MVELAELAQALRKLSIEMQSFGEQHGVHHQIIICDDGLKANGRPLGTAEDTYLCYGRPRSPNQRNVWERCDLRSAVGQQRDEVEGPIESQPWSMRNQASFFFPIG